MKAFQRWFENLIYRWKCWRGVKFASPTTPYDFLVTDLGFRFFLNPDASGVTPGHRRYLKRQRNYRVRENARRYGR